MTERSPRVPVSQETRDLVLEMLRERKPIPGIIGMEKSQNPAKIIFVTTTGRVACQVKEVDRFVVLELPSGKSPCPGFIKTDVMAIGWYSRAEGHQRAGHIEEEIGAYLKAIEIKPDFDLAWCGLGLAYDKSGRTMDAIAAYRQTIKLAPDNLGAWCGLGVTYAKAGRTRAAIAACRKAIEIEPDNAEAWYCFGKVYRQSGRAEAAAAFAAARKLKPELSTCDE